MDSRQELVKYARELLGKPYKYGAKPDEAPVTFDCSSFTQYLYKKIGVELPRTALEQGSIGEKVSPTELLEGDLLFFKGGWGHYNPDFPQGIGHVGIYAGNYKVINARYNEETGGSVIEEPVENFTDRPDFVIAKRII